MCCLQLWITGECPRPGQCKLNHNWSDNVAKAKDFQNAWKAGQVSAKAAEHMRQKFAREKLAEDSSNARVQETVIGSKSSFAAASKTKTTEAENTDAMDTERS